MSQIKSAVGIDPGVTTGVAFYDLPARAFVNITSGKILDMMALVHEAKPDYLLMEDARLRRWFGKAGREKLQGVGSIKRDCQIWEDFLIAEGIDYSLLKPTKGTTKWEPAVFRAYTGYLKRTNEHSRDAAVLILHNLDLAGKTSKA